MIGTYNPKPKMDPYQTDGKPHKDLQLDVERVKYWIGVGAQPTKPVWRFLSMMGILEPKYTVGSPASWDRQSEQVRERGKEGDPVLPARPEAQKAGRP